MNTESLVESYERFIGPLPDNTILARAPGRIEILGNHTDYNGGRMLSTTIDKFVWTLGTPADEVHLHSTEFNSDVAFYPSEVEEVAGNDWSRYVRGTYWAFSRRKHRPRGLRGVVTGNISMGAGLGSSAALSVSLANAIAGASGLTLHSKALAMLAFESERIFCRAPCGIQDQFTSQLGKRNSLLAIYSARLQTQDVPVPDNASLLVINSMISRASEKALTVRREECRQALAALNEAGFALPNLSAIDPEDLQSIEDVLEQPLSMRVRHLAGENARVASGVDALGRGDLALFGKLMNDSHASSRDLYEVSHPNLDMLVEMLGSREDVMGARMTGVGFGGSVVALVRSKAINDVGTSTLSEYEEKTGISAEQHVCTIPGGVTVGRVSC